VFNMKGDYLKTLVVGRPINYFCYDKDNNRIIMNLDDEINTTQHTPHHIYGLDGMFSLMQTGRNR
jgi:hypothetical protein